VTANPVLLVIVTAKTPFLLLAVILRSIDTMPLDHNEVLRQQRWLIFLRHCAKCRLNEHECILKNQCTNGKQLWQHILQCENPACKHPDCKSSTDLLKHYQQCQVCCSGNWRLSSMVRWSNPACNCASQDTRCPSCVPVNKFLKITRVSVPAAAAAAAAEEDVPKIGQSRYYKSPCITHSHCFFGGAS
jgi:hypothetical protein